MVAGWIYTHGLASDNEFSAVDEAAQIMPATEAATTEVAPVATKEVAPAAEEAMPAVDAAAPAEYDNQEVEPAQ
jgi:hypothetical protein